MRRDSFIVYEYRYAEMKRPRRDAVRREHGDIRDYDALPPTVIRMWHVGAVSKRDALAATRALA